MAKQNEHLNGRFGETCAIDATIQTIKHIKITAVAASRYANDGRTIVISSQTWDADQHPNICLNVLTIPPYLRPPIAYGRPEVNKTKIVVVMVVDPKLNKWMDSKHRRRRWRPHNANIRHGLRFASTRIRRDN